MLYVMILGWKSGLSREQRDGAFMRRSQWQYPAGIKVHGEYWPASEDVAVVSIFETDAFEQIMEISLTWGDLFDVRVIPATTPEAGLKAGAAILQRRMG